MYSPPPQRPTRPERRRHLRLEVDAEARLTAGTIVLDGRIENIGPAGAAFGTPTMTPEIPVGTRIALFAPGAGDDGGDLELVGQVVRAEPMSSGFGDTVSYALEFDDSIDA